VRVPGLDGVVAVSCVVLPDGSVANCKIARPLGRGIDEAVLLTVQNEWRFAPALSGATAVPVEATVEVTLAGY
jgi:TonB family protein